MELSQWLLRPVRPGGTGFRGKRNCRSHPSSVRDGGVRLAGLTSTKRLGASPLRFARMGRETT